MVDLTVFAAHAGDRSRHPSLRTQPIEEEFFSVCMFALSELTKHARVQPVGMIEW